MRLSARTFAAMLIGLALAAAQPDANSQSRGNSRSSSVSRSTRPSGNSGSSATKPSAQKPTNKPSAKPEATKPSSSRPEATRPAAGQPNKPSANKPDNSVSRPVQNKPTASKPGATKPSASRPAAKPSDKPTASRPSSNKPASDKPSVSRPAPQKPAASKPSNPRPTPGRNPGYRPGHSDRPIGVTPPSKYPKQPRVHPRDKDFMDYNKVTIHWKNNPHYYGYRIHTLPPKAIIRTVGGIKYYVYNDIWYRPYNGYYVVSRPPVGISLAASIVSGIAWTAIQLSYYNTINENNEYIAQQNAVIAQNNATIAAQNKEIALSQSKAQAAYGLAKELGLVQSYGSASASYFYQDGVFYSQGPDGEYYVIVPPAGAMVDRLPEDFDVVILNGNKYYKVDETVYQMVVQDGVPYFEVLGQMY